MPKFDPSLLRNDLEDASDLPVLDHTVVDFIPSSHQKAIFEFAEKGSGSAIVDAVAGSGKTTTILHLLSILPFSTSAILLAFNRPIADTLREKLKSLPNVPSGAEASTFHSAGFRALIAYFKRERGIQLQITSRKMGDLMRQRFTSFEKQVYGEFCGRLVGLAKNEGVGTSLCPDTETIWQELYLHHDLELEDSGAKIERAIQLSRKLLDASNEQALTAGVIDFDDQLYLIAKLDIPMAQHDWVFIDEAQDTNPVRRDMVRRLLREDGRLIAVGDPAQAIFGFTGASHDALDRIRTDFHAITLPLSVNYRCSLAVVEKTQTLAPHLQAREGAPQGKVATLALTDIPFVLTAKDAILCRNNAPLVPLAYDLISQGIGATVLGRDIGKGLIDLIRQMRAGNLQDLTANLNRHAAHEVSRYHRLNQPEKADQITDKVDCVLAILAHVPLDGGMGDVYDAVEKLFADEKVGVLTLGTVHKAKGKEWNQVAILKPELMPAKWARLPWQQQQEENLKYVAWTRAKENLFFIGGIQAPEGEDFPPKEGNA